MALRKRMREWAKVVTFGLEFGARAVEPERGVVRFENVGLRYGLGPEVLRDLTFSIEPQSFQFLTGPSGAGKTSLLRLLFLAIRNAGIHWRRPVEWTAAMGQFAILFEDRFPASARLGRKCRPRRGLHRRSDTPGRIGPII